jgi:glycosyltransferase involved in cell wall biosynthesis
MKVAIVTPFFWPSQGGVEHATLSLARELRSLCDISVQTLNATSGDRVPTWRYWTAGLPERETAQGIEVQRHSFFRMPVLGFCSPGLIAAVNRSRPDIVHVQGFSMIFNNLLLQLVAGGSFVLTLHGLYEGMEKLRSSRLWPIVSPLIAHYLGGFDSLVVLSQMDRTSLKALSYPPRGAVVIPNGVDAGRFAKCEDFVIRDGRKSILCVARFDTNKGHEDLVQALAITKDAGVDFRAYLVGGVVDARYLRKIERLTGEMGLGEDVCIRPSISDAQLADCYLASDVFVLPSRQETSPLVILEAMHAGLPIIATKVGGIPELVADGVHGYLVEPARPEHLAEKLTMLLRDEAARAQFRERNQRRARRSTWEAVAEQTFCLYEEVLSRRGRSVSIAQGLSS